MEPDVHYLSIVPNGSNIFPQLERLHTSRGPTELYWSIARNAALYARQALSPEATECYMLQYLTNYARLWSAWAESRAFFMCDAKPKG